MKPSSFYNYLFLLLIIVFALFGGVLTESRNYSFFSKEGMAFRHLFGSLHRDDDGEDE
jgi:hypothetical protein